MKRSPLASALVLATLCPLMAAAQSLPPGYPADYPSVIAAAEQEGKVVVYSTTDSASADALLKDFRALYPRVQIQYHDLNSTEVYNRFLSETAAKADTADVLWSGSMDLQLKLVSDGHAMVYRSPESAHMPKWAVHEDRAWGTTFEPLVMAYNKRLLPAEAVPKSHAELLQLLKDKPQLLAGGKLTTYDPEKSGFAFLLLTQDEKYFPQFWELAAAFGRGTARYYPSSGTMIERITSGEHLLGDVAGRPHHQERAAAERRQAIPGLSHLRARAENHGEPGDAVLAAHRRRGAALGGGAGKGARRPPQADPGRHEPARRAGAGEAAGHDPQMAGNGARAVANGAP